MATQTFTPGTGRLAVDRYDFQSHVDGYGFQHNASAIEIIPSIPIAGSPQTDVYSALDTIGSELADLALSGKGFILVGDGYDTYHNSIATPDAPYDSSIPAFNAYLSDVLNNTANPLHFRIRSGGIVVIKAGTYKFTGSVSVPAGITLMGEGYGTKIVNQSDGYSPLFVIQSDATRISDNGIDSTDKMMFARETMLLNMVIADNFPEPKFLGDVAYKNPISGVIINAKPLVSLVEGASLTVENVKFIGKTTYTLGTLSNVAATAIGTDSTVPVSSGTRLKVVNTSIDGFAVPVIFSTAGKYNSNCDISGSLIKAYGFLGSDLASAANNVMVKLNVCNANIVNNYFVGNNTNVVGMVYVAPSGTTNLQGKGKMVVANNNAAIARSSTSANNTFKTVYLNGSPASLVNLVAFGNNFTDTGFTVEFNTDTATGQLSVDAGGIKMSNSGVLYAIRAAAATATIDAAGNVSDYIVMANTPSATGAFTITLPAGVNGRFLTVKDMGQGSTKNITLAPAGSDNIEGLASSYVMNGDFQVLKFVYYSTSWWII
jgi:hypothetical protein